MEKYFDDPSTITEEEVLRALRNATVQMAVVPMLCGSFIQEQRCTDIARLRVCILAFSAGYRERYRYKPRNWC